METPDLFMFGCKVSSMVFETIRPLQWLSDPYKKSFVIKICFLFSFGFTGIRLQITYFSFVQNISGGNFVVFLTFCHGLRPGSGPK